MGGKYRGGSDTGGGGGLKEAKDGVKLFAFGLSLNSWIKTIRRNNKDKIDMFMSQIKSKKATGS